MRKSTWALAIVALLSTGFWWLLIEGSAPEEGAGTFDLAELRALVAQDASETLPTELRVEMLGTDIAPGFAVQAGDFGGEFELAYTAFQFAWPDGSTIVIGGAVDADFARESARAPDHATFSDQAYDALLKAYSTATSIYITHGHSDHVIAIARHSDFDSLAPRLKLTEYQKAFLKKYAVPGSLGQSYDDLPVEPFAAGPIRIAPGLVLVPSAGHTPNSQSFYARLSDGREVLLVGDIVWSHQNIPDLTTRPRILQYLVFDPDEDREQVLGQVRDLHELESSAPNLHIIPSHDRTHLNSLIAAGALTEGFVESQKQDST